VRNAARVVKKILKRIPRWTVGETLSIIRTIRGASVQGRQTVGDRAVSNKWGEEGKRGNMQEICPKRGCKIHGFYIGAVDEYDSGVLSFFPHS